MLEMKRRKCVGKERAGWVVKSPSLYSVVTDMRAKGH